MSIGSLLLELIRESTHLLDALALRVAASLASWLLTYAVHSTLLIALVALVTRWRTPPSYLVRDTLWKVALVGGVLTAGWQTTSGFESLSGRVEVARAVDPTVARTTRDADYPMGAGEAVNGAPRDVLTPTARAVSRLAGIETPDEDAIGKLVRLDAPPEHTSTRPSAMPARTGAVTPSADDWRDSAWPSDGLAALAMGGRSLASRPGAMRFATLTEPSSYGLLASDAVQVDAPRTGSRGEGSRASDARRDPRSWGFESRPRAGIPGWLPPRWPLYLCVIWLTGAAVAVARAARLWLRVDRLVAGRRRVESGPLRNIVDELCARAGRAEPVIVSVSPNLSGPVALGRREICLPARVFTDLDGEQQRSVLAHELAHIVRRDPLWLIVASTLAALLFFQPLNVLVIRRMRETAEYLCDDWAVQRTGSGLTLARSLAEVAGWIERRREPMPIAGMTLGGSGLARRVQRLLEDTRPRSSGRLAAWRRPIAALAIVGLAWIGPGVSALVLPFEQSAADPSPPPVVELGSGREIELSAATSPGTVVLDRSSGHAIGPEKPRRFPPIVIGPDDGSEFVHGPTEWSRGELAEIESDDSGWIIVDESYRTRDLELELDEQVEALARSLDELADAYERIAEKHLESMIDGLGR